MKLSTFVDFNKYNRNHRKQNLIMIILFVILFIIMTHPPYEVTDIDKKEFLDFNSFGERVYILFKNLNIFFYPLLVVCYHFTIISRRFYLRYELTKPFEAIVYPDKELLETSQVDIDTEYRTINRRKVFCFAIILSSSSTSIIGAILNYMIHFSKIEYTLNFYLMTGYILFMNTIMTIYFVIQKQRVNKYYKRFDKDCKYVKTVIST